MSPIDKPPMHRVRLLVCAVTICMAPAEAAQSERFKAACTSVPRHLWLSLQALETKVEALGYKVQKSRVTSTCAAIEALNEEGARVELFVDPTNGEIKGLVKP